MKIKKFLAGALILSSMFFFSNCGPSSVKGKWTDSDKKAMREGIEKQDLSNMGENKEAYIDCCISNLENSYENIDEAGKDAEGVATISGECAQQFAIMVEGE